IKYFWPFPDMPVRRPAFTWISSQAHIRRHIRESHMLSSNIPTSPSILEIKPASNTINIQNFSGKKKAGINLALHRLEIDFRKLHPATGYKLLFEITFAINTKSTVL